MMSDETVLNNMDASRELIDADPPSTPGGEFSVSGKLNDVAKGKSTSALATASLSWYSSVGFSRAAIASEGIRLGRRLGPNGQAFRVTVGQFSFFFSGTEQEVADKILSMPSSWDEDAKSIKNL
jgi:hypothetical protein